MAKKNPSNPLVSAITKTHYTIQDKKYDRITSVLDFFCPPNLVDWKIKNKNAKAISKTAKAIGTRVHRLIYDDYIKGRYSITANDSPAVANCMEAYKNWKSIEKPNIISMEQTVWSDELGVGGTYDIELSDRLVSVKTSDSIRDNYWVQDMMYLFLKGYLDKGVSILRLDKLTGEYQYTPIKPYHNYYVNLFKGLLNYYRYCQKPEVKEIEDIEVLENPFERSFI